MCRRFTLVRDQHDGVNQPGIAAEGVLFSTGKVVLAWIQPPRSMSNYDFLSDVLLVQNQNGVTRLVWLDEREDRVRPSYPPDRRQVQVELAALLGEDHVLVSSEAPRSTRMEFVRRAASEFMATGS